METCAKQSQKFLQVEKKILPLLKKSLNEEQFNELLAALTCNANTTTASLAERSDALVVLMQLSMVYLNCPLFTKVAQLLEKVAEDFKTAKTILKENKYGEMTLYEFSLAIEGEAFGTLLSALSEGCTKMQNLTDEGASDADNRLLSDFYDVVKELNQKNGDFVNLLSIRREYFAINMLKKSGCIEWTSDGNVFPLPTGWIDLYAMVGEAGKKYIWQPIPLPLNGKIKTKIHFVASTLIFCFQLYFFQYSFFVLNFFSPRF